MARQATSIQKDIAARVRLDTSRLPRAVQSPFARLVRWWMNSVPRLLVLEGIASLRRNGWIREIRALERLDGKDSIRHWMDTALIPAACTNGYMLHMQQMEVHHPFLSISDLLLLSRTWRAGLEYGIHIGRLQIQEESCDQLSQVRPRRDLIQTAMHPSGRHYRHHLRAYSLEWQSFVPWGSVHHLTFDVCDLHFGFFDQRFQHFSSKTIAHIVPHLFHSQQRGFHAL